MTVRVRIAPSPTGDPHVGTAYIALFNQAFARHFDGTFILRIEDTDQERSKPEYEKNIFDALRWCGLEWDEGPDVGGNFGPYRQSERLELYKKYAEELLDKDKAYPCFCTPEELAERKKSGHFGYDGTCRYLTKEQINEKKQTGLPYVIRLKMPKEGTCTYEDGVKGSCSAPWADIDDQILLKSDGFPTYHLANVVDDKLMEITHVIRGDEWISSTPKHIYLYESFGWEAPKFLHMPLLLGIDGKKLSKRRNPTSIFFYKDSGYLNEALRNFLTLMGYSMPDEREVYTFDELVTHFDPKRIGSSGAIFDTQKLNWLNQEYILKNIPEEELWTHIKEWSFQDAFMQKLIPLCRQRIKTFGDFMELAYFFFINDLTLTEDLLTPKSISPLQSSYLLQSLIWHMEEREAWNHSGMYTASKEIAQLFGVNHKKVVMPLLFASLMGKKQGLPLFDSVELLGKERTRARLLKAIQFMDVLSKKKLESLQKAWKNGSCASLYEEAKC